MLTSFLSASWTDVYLLDPDFYFFYGGILFLTLLISIPNSWLWFPPSPGTSPPCGRSLRLRSDPLSRHSFSLHWVWADFSILLGCRSVPWLHSCRDAFFRPPLPHPVLGLTLLGVGTPSVPCPGRCQLGGKHRSQGLRRQVKGRCALPPCPLHFTLSSSCRAPPHHSQTLQPRWYWRKYYFMKERRKNPTQSL